MTIDDILGLAGSLPGSLVLSPESGSEYPEIAWGDHFLFYSPGGQVPQRTQPYATVVTKDYPGDTESRLDADDRWRINIHVTRERFANLVGQSAADVDFSGVDLSATDTVLPHPVYSRTGLVAVVNPGERTNALVAELLREAHDRAVSRAHRTERR